MKFVKLFREVFDANLSVKALFNYEYITILSSNSHIEAQLGVKLFKSE